MLDLKDFDAAESGYISDAQLEKYTLDAEAYQIECIASHEEQKWSEALQKLNEGCQTALRPASGSPETESVLGKLQMKRRLLVMERHNHMLRSINKRCTCLHAHIKIRLAIIQRCEEALKNYVLQVQNPPNLVGTEPQSPEAALIAQVIEHRAEMQRQIEQISFVLMPQMERDSRKLRASVEEFGSDVL